jgi:hypothetical protein
LLVAAHLSELRSIGTFSNGNAAGPFPGVNQLNGAPANFAGGIGINSGVCLCTGVVTDADSDGSNAVAGSGVGVQGPNNGFPLSSFFLPPPAPGQTPINAGEVSFITNKPRDRDFREDSWAESQFQNIATLKSPGEPDTPMSLRDVRNCGPTMFRSNQVAPAPDVDLIPQKQVFDFPTSEHGFDTNEDSFNRPNDGVPYYNHEFAGFSKKLTRETPFALAPATYTIKIVAQDLDDRKVDSAVFLENGSLKLFNLRQGDYNGNGVVDAADYVVWRDNLGSTESHFYQGDGSGDGVVDNADYGLWVANFGLAGNKDFCSDFNRDGLVNDADTTIMSPYYEQLGECASRFEGDADGDGDVDSCDLDIWGYEQSNGTPAEPCACAQQLAGGGEMMLALTSSELAELKSQFPQSADMDGNGTVDEYDITALDAAIYAAFDKMNAAKVSEAKASQGQPEPTLAEPQLEFAPTRETFGPVDANGSSTNEGLEPVPAQPGLPPGFPVPPSLER